MEEVKQLFSSLSCRRARYTRLPLFGARDRALEANLFKVTLTDDTRPSGNEQDSRGTLEACMNEYCINSRAQSMTKFIVSLDPTLHQALTKLATRLFSFFFDSSRAT